MPNRNHHEELMNALEGLLERSAHEPVKVGDVLSVIREDGFSLISIIHVLPFLQPISLGPVSVAAGISLGALGSQMFRGKRTPWLPERMATMQLSSKTWRILLKTCEKVLTICRRIARPRFQVLASGLLARKLGGLVLMIAGILLAVPLAGIPFTNTIPALAILFACIAELEQDGWFMVAALAATLLAIAYFVFLGWAAWAATGHTLDWMNTGKDL